MVEQNKAATDDVVVGEPVPTPNMGQVPPPIDPNLQGDVQGQAVANYLRRRINEEQFDAFCVDCQDSRSTHFNVTFGTFICSQCAELHATAFPMYLSYVKTLFNEAWDPFQIRTVQVGGNKRFFDFMKDYEKEREPIHKKYDSTPAHYYRRRLCAEAKSQAWTEEPPARNVSEAASRAYEKTGAFFKETDEKYQVAEKANQAAQATKAGISSLWGKSKSLFKKESDQPAASGQ